MGDTVTGGRRFELLVEVREEVNGTATSGVEWIVPRDLLANPLPLGGVHQPQVTVF